MGKLIEFVMENLFIIVIIAGFLGSVLFRKSPLEKRPPNRMPDFGGGDFGLPRRQPGSPGSPHRPVQPVEPPRSAGAPYPTANPAEWGGEGESGGEGVPSAEWQRVYAELEREEAQQREKLRQLQRQRAVRPADKPANASEPPDAAASPAAEVHGWATSRDELVRAVQWAEILGPPRARRPFRR